MSDGNLCGLYLGRDMLCTSCGWSCGKLLTNAERCRRGLVDDPLCAVCGNGLESIMHISRGCRLLQNYGATLFQLPSSVCFLMLLG